jgi:uncharacterized protein YqeY
MDTKLALETALREAMRAKNDVALRTIRSVISAMKMAQIEKGKPLDESGISAILQKEVKSRRESIADAEKAGRPDLVDANKAEIVILEGFLPEQLSESELENLVRQAITDVQASSPTDMGKVMKILLPKVQGRVAGDLVSQCVRRLLAG